MSSVIGNLGEFSDGVLSELRQQGWSSTSAIDAEPTHLQIRKWGFTVNANASEAAKHFGGYTFHFPNGGVAWLRFDACPIAGGGGYIVLMCPTGRVALLHEQWFCLFIFESLAGLFEAIILNDRSRGIEFPDVESYRPD